MYFIFLAPPLFPEGPLKEAGQRIGLGWSVSGSPDQSPTMIGRVQVSLKYPGSAQLGRSVWMEELGDGVLAIRGL